MRALVAMAMCGVFLAGCATTREATTVTSEQAPQATGTTATRLLPKEFSGPVKVVLKVNPAPGTTGIIITETPPAGWKMVRAVPPWDKVEDNSYKWLKWDISTGNLAAFQILYEAAPPDEVEGEQAFEGTVHTRREGVLKTSGDAVTVPKAKK